MLGLSVVVLFAPRAPAGGEVFGIDKVIHAVLFALLAASTRARFRTGLGWVLVYAVGSEVLQAVLPISRDGSLPDVVADAVGALLGWWALALRVGR